MHRYNALKIFYIFSNFLSLRYLYIDFPSVEKKWFTQEHQNYETKEASNFGGFMMRDGDSVTGNKGSGVIYGITNNLVVFNC